MMVTGILTQDHKNLFIKVKPKTLPTKKEHYWIQAHARPCFAMLLQFRTISTGTKEDTKGRKPEGY